MTRYYHDSSRKFKELRGHSSWNKWHKAVRVQLDMMGLQHLLQANLRPLSVVEHYTYAADQQRAVQLLVTNMSEQVLQKLWNCGWEITGATLKSTLALLTDLMAEPEQHPQQSYETHRDIVDLARIDLAPGTKGFDQFLADAQQCHLRLLARYGGGNGTVEELLEHLFTSSIMEGLRAAKPTDYTEWMRALERETRHHHPFVEQIISLVKGPRVGGSGRTAEDAALALAGAPRGPREWERKEWERRRARRLAKRNRTAWRLPPYAPYQKRYRGKDYPDCYRPYHEGDAQETTRNDRLYSLDEIL
ncbi:hypothetical protein LEL_09559 [Akanthomyces lecanii RCEF 1005]|uniref:Uncharacterized protein n=1 Tax=Akanthomyces lecanii RCEF 1005 TaxID=1081108 RepID=A0A168C5R0_CORDF|nr:hypothetical protein LEL_09559 [Akanthomyces lecanii RCEF 1005]